MPSFAFCSVFLLAVVGCTLGATSSLDIVYEFPPAYSLTGSLAGNRLSDWTVYIDKTSFRSRLVNMTLTYPTPTTNNWYFCDESGWSVYILSHSEATGCLPTTIFQPPFIYCGIVYASCADLYADNAHNNFPMAGIIHSDAFSAVDYSFNARGMACPPLPNGVYTYDNATGTPLYTTPANVSGSGVYQIDQISYAFVDAPDGNKSQVLPSRLIQVDYMSGGVTIPLTYTYPDISFDTPSTSDIEGTLGQLCNQAPPFATPKSIGCGWFCLNDGILTVGSIVPLTGFKYETATALGSSILISAAVPVTGQPNLALVFGDSDTGQSYGIYNIDTTKVELFFPSPSLVYGWVVPPACTPDGASCYVFVVNQTSAVPERLLMRIDFDLSSMSASQPQLVASLDVTEPFGSVFSIFVDDSNSTVFVLIGEIGTKEIFQFSTDGKQGPVVIIPPFPSNQTRSKFVLLTDFVSATHTFFGIASSKANSFLVQFSLETKSYGPLNGLLLDQVPQDGFFFAQPARGVFVDKQSPNLQQPIISYVATSNTPLVIQFLVTYDLQASQLTWMSSPYLDLGDLDCSFAASDYFQPS